MGMWASDSAEFFQASAIEVGGENGVTERVEARSLHGAQQPRLPGKFLKPGPAEPRIDRRKTY
jgi:hypothetical protein